MILVIDNYDSFSYNLVQIIGSILAEKDLGIADMKQYIQVRRNDEIMLDEVEQMHPSHIILSPGPKRPKDAGICESLIQKYADKYRILGVCLGHQAICETFGGVITYANELMHGKQSRITLDTSSSIFEGLSEKEYVARYHSLVVDKATIPDCLRITARDRSGEVMAVEHKEYPVYGVQFHPESVLTPKGRVILSNFLKNINQ